MKGLYKGTQDGCLPNQGLNYDNHPGYDYYAEMDTPVKAAAGGKVVNILNESTVKFGLCVPKGIDTKGCEAWGYVGIDHENGYVTQYGHLSDIKVQAGETVVKGQLIGLSGQTSPPYTDKDSNYHQFSVGPHLHFEVLKVKEDAPYGYTFVDPYGWEGSPKEDYLEIKVSKIQNIRLWDNPLAALTTDPTRSSESPPMPYVEKNKLTPAISKTFSKAKKDARAGCSNDTNVPALDIGGAQGALKKFGSGKDGCSQ